MGKYGNKIDLSHSEEESKKRMDAAAKRRIEAGREFFIRFCIAEGIDPANGISPSLKKLIGGKV